VVIDLDAGHVTVENAQQTTRHDLGSAEGFAAVSAAWLRAGWDTKHVYSFTWLGRPIIQLPEDVLRLQELVYRAQPDVIVETGVAHGGSLVLWATLCRALGRGRVIGVDIDIREHNRAAIEAHVLAPLITLIEGDSATPETAARVRGQIAPGEDVLIVLDSGHSRDHVAAELEAYAPLVRPGGYIVAMDGIMENLAGAPRTATDWTWNNPARAVTDFTSAHPEFVSEEPAFLFNEGAVAERITYGPGGILRRRTSDHESKSG
jgi:cephalosporin hydroxylase